MTNQILNRLATAATQADDQTVVDMAILLGMYGMMDDDDLDEPDDFIPAAILADAHRFAWNCPCAEEECTNYAEVTVIDDDHLQLYIEQPGPLKSWATLTLQEFADQLAECLLIEDGCSVASIQTNDMIDQALIAWLAERNITLPTPTAA